MTDAVIDPNGPKLDRRAAMAWAGALAAALGATHYYGIGFGAADGPVTPGYGRDPDMLNPHAPWPRLMTERQLASVRRIVDFILPHEGEAPSASDVGVHELIDEWVSAPYPEHSRDRALIFDGLTRLDLMARRDGTAKDFAGAGKAAQAALLALVADPASKLATAAFWKRLRRLVIGGYYTTEAGFADIGYIGNQPLPSYPAPTAEMRSAMERVFAQLGLVDRTASGG
ncbi:gluconate 2-dehydrogenase subunit 3 family protein [Sphingopyxis panaciterrae]